MKLIDLLVQKLPKRGGWPAGAEYAKVTGFGGEKILVDFLFPKAYNKLSYSIGIIACHLIDAGAGVDFHMIRRDSYESALATSQKQTWNGEGLPPVGCECEISFSGKSLGQCEVLFVGDSLIVWKQKSSQQEGSGYHRHMNIRPLRTESERKRDEAIKGMASVIDYRNGCSSKPLAGWIYDAIAAGKIPGVKLED